MRIAVFPGSFDPVTIGHQDIIARASKLFDRVYVSIVPNGTKTHPMFTDEQKLALMRASVEEFPNVEAELGGGLLTDYALRKNAQFLVRGVRNSVDFDAEQQLLAHLSRCVGRRARNGAAGRGTEVSAHQLHDGARDDQIRTRP